MLLHIKNILLLLLFGLFTKGTNAQTSFASLQDLWNYADKHNIQVQTATANKSITNTNVKQAYGSMLPVVSANGGFTDNIQIQSTLIPANLFNPAAPAGVYTEATFGRRYNYNGNISAQFDILNTQDWFNVKAAKLNNELAALNIAKVKMDLYEQLANAYYSCLLLTEAEKLSAKNLQTATTVYSMANDKYNNGLVNEVTLNTALINKEKAAKNLQLSTENRLLQLNNLKALLNTGDSIIISEKWTDNIIVGDATPFVQDPNVQLSSTQLQLAKNQLKVSKAAFAPILSAVYQYNTLVAADDFLKFDNSNTIPQQYWGLRLSVPIFSGNSKRYQVQKSKTDYDLKQKQYDNAKLQSAINNQNILLAYNSSLNAFEKSKNILALYQSNDTHAERRMNEGIISLDDRLKYYSDLIINQNEYLQSMSDYFIQQYRLQIRQTNLLK